MKKSIALAAVCMLMSGQAWAYENLQAGYSVQDKDPFYKMASSRMYAYSGFSADALNKLEKMPRGSVHIVGYYTADEMTQILGEKFSTAYFNQQYEQIAVLQRSELDIRTVPCPLVDLERYTAKDNGNNIFLQQYMKEQFQTLKPIISIAKVNGNRAIKISYLYKQTKNLVAVDTTLLSANDRLYMLTTVTVDEKVYASQDYDVEIPNEETANTEDMQKKISEALTQALKIENVKPAEVDAKVIRGIDKTHTGFVKGFKAVAPHGTAKSVILTDSVAQKSITLPQDWFYAQIQFKEKEAAGTFSTAASLPTMQKIAQELDYRGIYGLFGIDVLPRPETSVEAAVPEQNISAVGQVDDSAATANQQAANEELAKAVEAKALEEARKALKNFDAMLLTCSFKVKDKDFQEFLTLPRSQQLQTEIFLRESLEKLKHSSNDDYVSLDDYSYNVKYTQENALIDINTKISVLKDFKFINLLRLATLANDSGSALLYVHKSEIPVDEHIMQGIDEWQF